METRRLSAAVIVAALLSGCVAEGDSSSQGPLETFTAPTPIVLGSEYIPLADLGESFDSLQELVSEAPAIVVVRPSPGDEVEEVSLVDPEELEELDPAVAAMLPSAYRVQMEVLEVIAGDLVAGEMIHVVSMFDLPGSDGTPLLGADSDFLLYLGHRTFKEGDKLEDYGVLGWLEGYYQRTAESEFTRLDPRPSALPKTVRMTSLRTEVSRAERTGARPSEGATK